MRTWTLFVHISLSYSPIFKPNVHVLLHFRDRIYLNLSQVFHKNAFLWTLFELHFRFYIFAQQIMYFFVVDFNKAASNEMCLWSIIFSYGYYLTKSPWDDAAWLLALSSTHHGVSLTASSLTVCKNGAIVPIEYVLNKRKCALLIDVTLGRFRCKNTIKRKTFWLLLCIFFDQKYLIVLWIYLNNADAGFINSRSTSLTFFGVHWSTSDHDLDSFCHFAPW